MTWGQKVSFIQVEYGLVGNLMCTLKLKGLEYQVVVFQHWGSASCGDKVHFHELVAYIGIVPNIIVILLNTPPNQFNDCTVYSNMNRNQQIFWYDVRQGISIAIKMRSLANDSP